MEFGILGALEARDGDTALPLGGARQRALLAVLLLHANEPLATERLVDELWGERPPSTAVKMVQVYVSRLRKLLGAELIESHAAGYALRIDPERLDQHCFERLAADGQGALAAGDAALARTRLAEALALWRGPVLADLAYEPFAGAAATRLEELRLGALEDRLDADLRCGESAELVAELRALTARHPLRERLRGQLMLALYRSGRQAEALDVYRDTRSTLVEELGLEPNRKLRELERSILAQDPALERPGARGAGIFVGRAAELRAAVGALAAAEAGRGGMTLIAGEPGAGKSRLADELAAHARDRGMLVLRGRCWEAGGAPPYWPWVQALRAHLRGTDAAAVRAAAGTGAPELAELLPELRELLGDVPRPAVQDAEALRFRLFDAVAAYMRAVGHERALLLVVDDLHAADEPSLLLLEYLAAGLDDARIAIVAGYRDTVPDLPPGIGRLTAERIALHGLAREEVAQYVRLATGRPPADAFVAALHQSTAGNPLFVTESVRLLEGGEDVPAGARDAIGRRLQGVTPAARAVLELAAAAGREFDPDLLERVEPDAVAALDEAIAARLVTAAAGAPGHLRFSHALVRDALYDALPTARRRALHRDVGEAIERIHAADRGPWLSTLAHHFSAAAAPGPAGRYARLAAERAAGQLASEEAARLYALALRALELRGGDDDAELCDLLLGLGEAHARSGNAAEAQATFLRAAEVARGGGLVEPLGRAALGYGGRFVWTVMRGDPHITPLLEEAIAALPEEDSELRARLLARLGGGPLKADGDRTRERRFALTAEAVAMARRVGDPQLLAWALDARKVAIWGPDTLEEHWAVIDELHQLAQRAGDPEQIVDAHICALIKLFERREVGRFEAEYARARLAADELGQPGQRWLVAVTEPLHALLVGRLDDAERLIGDAYELGCRAVPWNAANSALMQRFALAGLRGRLDDVKADLHAGAAANPWFAPPQAALAAACAELGDDAAARAAFEGLAADDFAAVPLDDEWLLTMGLLADACCALGDIARAAVLYDRLFPFAHRVIVAPLEIDLGSAARPLGKLAATLGRAEDAAGWFARAAAENEREGALPWAAHARREHGELLRDAGEPEAAAPLLGQAELAYRALGMEHWAARSRPLAGLS